MAIRAFGLGLLIAGCASPPAQAPAPPSDAEATALMYALLPGRLPGSQPAAVAAVVERGDDRLVAPIVDLMRFSDDLPWAGPTLVALTGRDHGGDWNAWSEWYGGAALAPPPGYARWKGELFAWIVEDPRYRALIPDGVDARVRLEEVVWGGVGVDGIPPLESPPTTPAAGAGWLGDDEFVVGAVVDGEARAWPLRIINAHELVNDVVGGVPVSLAYCTLCGAAVLYEARIDGVAQTFGTSGLLMQSNKLMYDRATGSLWNQLTGEPVIGSLARSGIRLTQRPSVVSTWAEWRALHPETRVLALDTGLGRTYAPDGTYAAYFASDDAMFPVWRRDATMPPKTRVFTLSLDGAHKAWRLDALETAPRHDRIGEVDVVLIGGGDAPSTNEPAGRSVRAYRTDGQRFTRGGESWTLTDGAGGVWKVTEEALLGPGGAALPRLAGHVAFWFGWFAFHPDTEVGAAAPR